MAEKGTWHFQGWHVRLRSRGNRSDLETTLFLFLQAWLQLLCSRASPDKTLKWTKLVFVIPTCPEHPPTYFQYLISCLANPPMPVPAQHPVLWPEVTIAAVAPGQYGWATKKQPTCIGSQLGWQWCQNQAFSVSSLSSPLFSDSIDLGWGSCTWIGQSLPKEFLPVCLLCSTFVHCTHSLELLLGTQACNRISSACKMTNSQTPLQI